MLREEAQTEAVLSRLYPQIATIRNSKSRLHLRTYLTTRVAHIKYLRSFKLSFPKGARASTSKSSFSITLPPSRPEAGELLIACLLTRKCCILRTKRQIRCTRSSSKGASAVGTWRRRRTDSISPCQMMRWRTMLQLNSNQR